LRFSTALKTILLILALTLATLAYLGILVEPVVAFSRVSSITLPSGEDKLESAIIDPSGQYAYFGTWTAPGKVVKINLSTFTRVNFTTLNTGEDNLASAVIDPSGQYAYFGTYTDPGIVVKINLSTFTRVGSRQLNTGENQLRSAVIDPTGQYAYFGVGTTPGKIVKVRLSDLTRVTALSLQPAEEGLYSAVIDPTGQYAYFGTDNIPGIIVKIRLSDFTRVDSITLESFEDCLESAVIDPSGQYAYFGTRTGPGRIIKVRLSDFTRVKALTLPPGEIVPNPAVIDPSGQYAYFGVGTTPGRIVKVRLSDLTRVKGLTLQSGEISLASAVVDLSGQYAYFGTWTIPGKVVKVSLDVSRLTLDSKTDPTGQAWASGTYLLGAAVNDTWSSGPTGDQSITSSSFTPTAESLTLPLSSSDKLLLIATSQLWNDYASIGSSICISRNGARISGDMFAVGASPSHRHLATAIALDTPGTGTYTYTLDFKTDPGGRAWASGTYLLATKISYSWSNGPYGDDSTTSTTFTLSLALPPITLASGDKLLLIATSQLWNDYPSIGSSICISRSGAGRISGDMFSVGASPSHRHLATAIAIDSPGAGTYTYALGFKTDPGGKAWVSGRYILAVKISHSWSSGPTGDQSNPSTSFTPTAEKLNLGFESGDKFLLIATSQLWNDNPSIGSSICISRDGTRVSGDMFAVGASMNHRHLATAIAIWQAT